MRRQYGLGGVKAAHDLKLVAGRREVGHLDMNRQAAQHSAPLTSTTARPIFKTSRDDELSRIIISERQASVALSRFLLGTRDRGRPKGGGP